MSDRKHRTKASTIQDVLKKIMAKFKEKTAQDQEQLLDSWKKISGERIFQHTAPEKILQQRLHIRVENATWMNELTYLKERITIQAIHEFSKLGITLKCIVFKIGDVRKHGHTSKYPT